MPVPRRRRARATRRRSPAHAAPAVVNVERTRSAPPPNRDGTIELSLFDATRQLAGPVEALIRLFNGRQQLVYQGTQTGPVVRFTNLHVADNLDDRFAVSVAVDGCAMTGFTPVVIRQGELTSLNLMLLPKSPGFDFTNAAWTALSTTHANLVQFLSRGASSVTAARARYEALMADSPRALAAFLNIWTAVEAIDLPGTASPVDYFKELDWTDRPPSPDRFFCYAHPDLVDAVVQAARSKVFEPEPHPEVFHHGATRSYKQVQFGEANVQLTFHENQKRTIDGVDCVLVEPDIDYYKDLLAHGLLEVASGKMTDPEQVYVLRWIAGQQAGIPPFEPPYTIVRAATRSMRSRPSPRGRAKPKRRRGTR